MTATCSQSSASWWCAGGDDAGRWRDGARAGGDRWAAAGDFDGFVRSRHVAMLRYAHAVTSDPELAADLVQDALERTGLAWPRVRRRDDPEGCVRRIMVTRYVSW